MCRRFDPGLGHQIAKMKMIFFLPYLFEAPEKVRFLFLYMSVEFE